MTDLLEKILHAHGGLDNWRRANTIDLRPTLRGGALALKQQPHGLRDVMVKIDTRRPRTLITPFPAPGSRGVVDNGRVTIETDAGVKTFELDEPRKSFEGHERQTPWNDSQFLYFVGYARHNYLTMPFLLANDGVHGEEIAPHEEHDESWRVLKVTFPSGTHVHCSEQKFYFNDAGYLVRNDYAPTSAAVRLRITPSITGISTVLSSRLIGGWFSASRTAGRFSRRPRSSGSISNR